MKKMLSFVVALVLSATLMAQTWDFPLNEYNEVVISNTIDVNCDAATAYTKFKQWLNTEKFSSINVVQDDMKSAATYNITKNTKSRYNPFAGQFNENLIFILDVKIENNKVSYTLKNMQIQETYAGYGVNNKLTAVGTMVKDVENAKKAIADAEASGDRKQIRAAKKQNEDKIENGSETLEKASKELQIIINNLRNAF